MQVNMINPVSPHTAGRQGQSSGRPAQGRLQSGSQSSAFAECQGGAPAPAAQAFLAGMSSVRSTTCLSSAALME